MLQKSCIEGENYELLQARCPNEMAARMKISQTIHYQVDGEPIYGRKKAGLLWSLPTRLYRKPFFPPSLPFPVRLERTRSSLYA